MNPITTAYQAFQQEDTTISRKNLRKAITVALLEKKELDADAITALFESRINVGKTNVKGVYSIGWGLPYTTYAKPTLHEMADIVASELASRGNPKYESIKKVIAVSKVYMLNSEFEKELDESLIIKKDIRERQFGMEITALIAKDRLAYELRV